jgi:hypothetical protein
MIREDCKQEDGKYFEIMSNNFGGGAMTFAQFSHFAARID